LVGLAICNFDRIASMVRFVVWIALAGALGLVICHPAGVLTLDQGSRTAAPSAEHDHEYVSVPEPSELALQRYRSGVALWIVNQIWALLVPALFLFTGFSARIRTWAQQRASTWPVVLAIYAVVYLLLNFAIDLPLAYYEGFVRPHAYGLSNQSLGHWLGNVLKALLVAATQPSSLRHLPGLLLGVPFLVVLYGCLRASPKRWWLYMGLFMIPAAIFVMLIGPLWIAPLFNRFGPMKDKALEAQILDLARRAGIEGGRVFEVDKSRDTKTVNAYVTGVFGAKRIVLWDTAIAQLEPRELRTVMGHEMGHYVLGHVTQGIALQGCLGIGGFYLVNLTGWGLIKRFKSRFGFDELSDVASVPLFVLLLNVLFLAASPLVMAVSRHFEHEADRFALEITHDNHAAATAFVKFHERNLAIPRPPWLLQFWLGSHPSLGDRIDFANEYRPWEKGQPEKYGRLFR
jgi:Zn-dependent protease with chaperone function